jgi:hypothetical protein
MRNSTNLYPGRPGHYIYKVKNRHDRWFAQIKFPMGFSKSALFYSLEDAIVWMETQAPKIDYAQPGINA